MRYPISHLELPLFIVIDADLFPCNTFYQTETLTIEFLIQKWVWEHMIDFKENEFLIKALKANETLMWCIYHHHASAIC